MFGVQRTMKLKVRLAILVCSALSFCAIFLALSQFPTLYDGRSRTFPSRLGDRLDGAAEFEDQPHFIAFRKRLNKSNFTSDNISPEFGKRTVEVKTLPNDTLEYSNKDVSDSAHVINAPEAHGGFRSNKNVDESKVSNHNEDGYLTFNKTDKYVDKVLYFLQSSNGMKFNFEKTRFVPYKNFIKLQTKRLRRRGMGLPIYRNYHGGPVLSNWERLHKGIHQYGLYDGDDSAVDGIIEDMASQQIVDIEMKEGGTQLKLIITFIDEGQALFKPMRYPREQETLPDHFYFVDYERHNAEIAAFHLDRILGFYRVPPTAGRQVNLTGEIRQLAESKLKKTFFLSPANNVCFHGICSYYCDTGHAVCGRPEMLEGSFATFLPPERIAPRKTWRNPWKRSYSKHRKAYWEVYDDLCARVQDKEPYNGGRRLLDVIDMHIFDFLTGNMDRHHYETFSDFGNETFLLHLDNGRGFGRPHHDEVSILAPLFQCCMVRYSTYIKLVKLYLGPETLSVLMRESMKKDIANPILTEPHLQALDRRVIKILKAIHDCIQTLPYTDVIVDDFF